MNRKKFKAIRLMAATALITALFSLTAFAGWEYIYGDWYYYDDYYGYYLSNQWYGNYYLGSDGVMLTNAWTPDGFYVGSDGEWTGATTGDSYSNYYDTYYNTSYYNSFQTATGTYFGLTYVDTYTDTYVDEVSIEGDVLVVHGMLKYNYGINSWDENATPMAFDTYRFQLYSGTKYMDVSEEVNYVTQAQFLRMRGPVLTIVVENGVVTEVYYSA